MVEFEIPFVCLIFTCLISFIYFIKKKVNIEENYFFRNVLLFTFLVVDDNGLNLKVVRKLLKDNNMVIDDCLSGYQCLELVNKNKYDVILMDVMMPGIDGYETLNILKNNSNFNTPVIAITADAVSGSREKYINSGFVEYIAKPFNRDELLEKIYNVTKNVSNDNNELL